jgi:exosortase
MSTHPSLSGPRVLDVDSEISSPSARKDLVLGTPVRIFWARWWPLVLGFFSLLGTTSYRFAESLWQQPEFEYGPLLLLISLWLLWRERAAIVLARGQGNGVKSATAIALGLVAYLLGVRLKAGYLEFAALAPILGGALYLMGGVRLLRRCAFSLLFLLLAIPLPAPILFVATSDLKEWVSYAAESILHMGGYPVARDGVTLRVGPYSLLLADACSGMNSLVSLLAVGLLYLYLTAKRRPWHSFLIVAAIAPTAIATNVVRVLTLTLITYYFGDEAGQGFLHEFAGFVLFLVAFLMLAGLDQVLKRIFPQPSPSASLNSPDHGEN